MNIPAGGNRSLLDPENIAELAEVLPALAEVLLNRDTASEVDIEVAEQLMNLSQMLTEVAAEQTRMATWLKVWAKFAKPTGLAVNRNPDVAEYDDELASDLLATAKSTIDWADDPEYWNAKGGAR